VQRFQGIANQPLAHYGVRCVLVVGTGNLYSSWF
jgi:hypothetical protein